MWLQDLDAWAAVLYRLLAPGGRLVLFEGHPAEWLFDVDADGGWIATDYDYFAGPEASKGWAPEYIDRLSIDDDDQHWKFARAWTLGEIVTALLGSGLTRRAPRRAPDRLVGRPRRRPGGRARADPAVLLGPGAARRLAGRAGLAGWAVDRHPGAVEGELDDRRALLGEGLAEGGLDVGVALDADAASAERAADRGEVDRRRAPWRRPRRSRGSSCHIRIVPNRSLSNTRTMIRAPSRIGGLELGHGHRHAAVARRARRPAGRDGRAPPRSRPGSP